MRPINCEGPAWKASFLGGIHVWCLNNHIPSLQPLFIQFIIRQQLVSVCFRLLSRARHTKHKRARRVEKSNELVHLLHPRQIYGQLFLIFLMLLLALQFAIVFRQFLDPRYVVYAHFSPYFMKTSIFYEEFALCNILC